MGNQSVPDPRQRVVRVFISSTFRDMQAERNELMKFVFPELGRCCRERQVEFVEVGLRWGITDGQKAEGKVLPLCLDEIYRCRPYSIGMLGERYGWVPENIPQELIKREPWLNEHLKHSVTELEILHGVLNNPNMAEHAFFYFRDPAYIKTIPPDKQKDFAETDAESTEKLRRLKDRIRKSGMPVHENYPNPKTFGELALEDLWKVIDKRFPMEEVPTALERERMDHEAFAAARQKVYIGRDEYFKQLDEHAASKGQPLVVLGESGAGKSALIANWTKEYQEKHPGDFMVFHYIGGTADSADYVKILRKIMEEIRNRYQPKEEKGLKEGMQPSGMEKKEDEIPTDPKKVVEQFPLWLAKVTAARGKFILVLDALNQLEDRDNAPDLGWLPHFFPENVRVILSTLPGKSLDALEKRNLPTMRVELLSPDERKQLIEKYLARFARELSSKVIEHIIAAQKTANPIYLKALLDEMRVYGDYDTLQNRIDHYLEATTIDDLYKKILERYEDDYERESEQKGMVRRAMSFIWAARRGLTETELRELLGSKDKPIPPAYWSPLYLAAEESLVSRSGLLNFFHDYLRKAVEDKYFCDTEQKRLAHLRLADYFDRRALDGRKADELPWQLKEAQEWERLKDCITDIPMFLILKADATQYELMGYWLDIGNRFDMVASYNTALSRWEQTKPSDDTVPFI